jgi:excinuclease ABC subunit B
MLGGEPYTDLAEFRLVSDFEPRGDQPKAIEGLVRGIERSLRNQVLLGVTGSGKTFTMAHVIARIARPTLVLAHNKTLAAQLFREFKELFPNNAVEYFVSYYDYYLPESYLPATDTYIAKDASINDELDKMRLSATRSVLERRDVIVVASVSCIYGIGSPQDFHDMVLFLREGTRDRRNEILRHLVDIQYQRNDIDFYRGAFRVRGDVVDIFPAYEERKAIRLEFFGDELDTISEIDALTGKRLRPVKRVAIYPSTFYVSGPDRRSRAVEAIREELRARLAELRAQNKLLEAQRLEQRTMYDLEMMEEMGTCVGIENYSRHLAGRAPGEPPDCLLDYFPEPFLLFIDESHQTMPQLHAMYNADRSRKETLVEYGFRLPSALDNRPLKFEEFLERIHQTVYVSATPAEWELQRSEGVVWEQVIRPTGLTDPPIEVRPASGQVDDLLGEIHKCVERGQRVLVTTLTKRMAEDLSDYYADLGLKVKYLHSDIHTIERTEIIRDLRRGVFDVLIGVNLLREGLDLPEVALVAILDADKEGFLRSTVSLIQTCGRAARNIDGRVIMYADVVTDSMQRAIEETDRRRALQDQFNHDHGITPESVKKSITNILDTVYEADYPTVPMVAEPEEKYLADPKALSRTINKLRKEMLAAAARLDFERAAELRDKLFSLEKKVTTLPVA